MAREYKKNHLRQVLLEWCASMQDLSIKSNPSFWAHCCCFTTTIDKNLLGSSIISRMSAVHTLVEKNQKNQRILNVTSGK
mgnify:FL=1